MISLSALKPKRGSKKRRKRVGCGESSGHGKTSGRGHKGQKARSGGSVRLGFEGGQMPLFRRLPKRGFNNHNFGVKWGVVNIRDLEGATVGSVIDEGFLRSQRLIRGRVDGIKILSEGDIAKAVICRVHGVSAAARRKIEHAGGRIELIEIRGRAQC